MWKRALHGILGLIIALGGVIAVLNDGAKPKQAIRPAVRYLAEEEVPTDQASEVVEWRHLQLYR
jgi:hypothetical protein